MPERKQRRPTQRGAARRSRGRPAPPPGGRGGPHLRVIAGSAGGRALRAPEGLETRPTADLIKGVIFSMLEAEAYKRGYEPDEEGRLAAGLAWPRVLDLFAGAGALGIEALSRGAVHAEFVERRTQAARIIQINLRSLDLDDRATVRQQRVEDALTTRREPVDAVFLDPPYADQPALESALAALARADILKETSVVVLEQAASTTPPERVGMLPLRDTRTHGRTRVTLYARADASAEE